MTNTDSEGVATEICFHDSDASESLIKSNYSLARETNVDFIENAGLRGPAEIEAVTFRKDKVTPNMVHHTMRITLAVEEVASDDLAKGGEAVEILENVLNRKMR